jgi:hypothetical protein
MRFNKAIQHATSATILQYGYATKPHAARAVVALIVLRDLNALHVML